MANSLRLNLPEPSNYSNSRFRYCTCRLSGLIAGKIPRTKLKTATILAVGKIIEKIEIHLRSQQNISKIHELAADRNYQTLFDDLFVPNGGWAQMIASRSAGSFDKDIMDLFEEAQPAVNVIDFSHRFVTNRPHINFTGQRKKLGGLDAARYVARKKYRPAVGETTMKNRWGRFGATTIFLYLILEHKFDLKPPKVQSADFAETLLRQASNTDQLRKFFVAYEKVRAALSVGGFLYGFPVLDLSINCSPQTLTVTKLSPDILEGLTDWINRQ